MTSDNKRPVEETNNEAECKKPKVDLRDRGIAFIKKEYIISDAKLQDIDDDTAEGLGDRDESGVAETKDKKKRKRGQNKKRELIQPKDVIQLCSSVVDADDGRTCRWGAEKCRNSHDIKSYLESKPADLEGECPNFKAYGYCNAGVKCRWLGSHYDAATGKVIKRKDKFETDELNKIDPQAKFNLQKKKYPFTKSNEMITYLDEIVKYNSEWNNSTKEEREKDTSQTRKDNQFDYVEAPFKPWEKKKLNYSRAKVVSPLTTVGNLPYRRLMKKLYDVDVTFSEMALTLPLIQGTNSEWALMKAHRTEYPGFGAQIATSKHWQAVKAAEVITEYCPLISEINLNCGCPIDLLYRQGAGSGLLEQPAKTLRMLRGMNSVSNDIPVTVKIRMGTKDSHPIADSLVRKILYEGGDVGAITLHGRSRQQRYTRSADWDYIGKIGAIVNEYNENQVEDKDSYDKPKVFFLGNGDCYNFQDWHEAVSTPGIDSVMIARGALIKPWLMDEIETGQYIDKSATERLEIMKQYAEFAINHWGSDEYGISIARRFMCEWLSFTYRYIPVGILERLPHGLNERPPFWKGRNELETLLGSGDYKDWIKITEMFLGPSTDRFNFVPKHKSNAY